MPPRVRQVVTRAIADGTWTGATPLTELPAVGPYIEARLRRALVGARPQPLTMAELVGGFRGMGAARVVEILHRALQNARANQCVSPSHTRPGGNTYHAGDVNEHGFASVATLLDIAKRQGVFGGTGLRFAPPLPRPRPRSRAARDCGCRPRDECDGPCTYVDGACIPRDNRARGFLGSPYHPDQSVAARSAAERDRVRRAARTRVTQQVRGDAAGFSDLARGHSRAMRYVSRGRRMWRVPGTKVRLPLVRRR